MTEGFNVVDVVDVVVGAAEAVADGSAEAVGSGGASGSPVEAGSPVVEPSEATGGAPVVAGGTGTSGVGWFSGPHEAAETDAATITASPAARRAQKGQAAPAGMCRRQRAHGDRLRIEARLSGRRDDGNGDDAGAAPQASRRRQNANCRHSGARETSRPPEDRM